MIRRTIGRLRRTLRAVSMPPRNLLHDIARLIPTLMVTTTVLSRAAIHSMRRLGRRAARRPGAVRVGVDIRPYYEPLTGVGWYLHHVLTGMLSDPEIEIIPFGEPLLTDSGPRFRERIPGDLEPVRFDLRGRPVSRFTLPIVRTAYPILAALQNCDVFFGANYFLPRSLSAVARKRVVTVHDLTFRRFPELVQTETLNNLQSAMEREIFRSDAIISVSEVTRRDLIDLYDLEPSKIETIHSGLAPIEESRTAPASLPKKYILFVSTVEPRKDLATLIDAFEQLKRDGRYDGMLVIVGKVGWKSEATMRRLETSPWKESILHLHYVRREDLGAIYRGAHIFVLPSIYEGFGFPLLEAMAKGIPSVAAESSSLPEVGGDAALYFPPGDSASLARVIERLATDDTLRAEMIARGREQAARFQWSAAAGRTTQLLKRVARGA